MASQSSCKDAYVAACTNKLEEERASTGAASGVDRHGLALGRWARGMLQLRGDCVPNGFLAFLCPGVALAQITARLGLARYSLVLALFAALYLLALLTALMASPVLDCACVLAALIVVLAVARLRSQTRALFAIPGHTLKDVASAFLCGPCAIAQMANHVEAYRPGECSFRPRSTLDGYVRQ